MFTNAKICAGGVDPEAYIRTDKRRGDLDFPMSRSELVEFDHCPHRWLMGYRDHEGTDATEWGTLIDALLLDSDKFDERFAVSPETYPDSKTGEPKPWTFAANVCKEWKKDQGSKTVVKHANFVDAQTALGVLNADERVVNLVQNSQHQVMVVGEYADTKTGITIPVKALIDMVPTASASLCDFKTSRSASPSDWRRFTNQRGYHVQAAWFLDLYNAASGESRNGFLHVIQENVAPWEIGKRFLSEEFLKLGREKYQRALARYCRCLKDNSWPGYDDESALSIDGFQITEPEAWMIA